MSIEVKIEVHGSDGAWFVEVCGRRIYADDHTEALHIQQVLEAVYQKGGRDARREMRTALGLHNWGRDVSCTDN